LDYQGEIESKQKIIYQLKNEIKLLKLKQAIEKTGFNIGDLIVDKKGVRGVISSFDGYWFYWKKLKKDGTPSKASTYVYGIDDCKKVVKEGDSD